MKALFASVATLPFAALMLVAQSNGGGQSWNGVLVAAACRDNGMTTAGAAMGDKAHQGNHAQDAGTGTTPTANKTYERRINEADRSSAAAPGTAPQTMADMHGAANDTAMPKTSPTVRPEQTRTYEQTMNQADRSSATTPPIPQGTPERMNPRKDDTNRGMTDMARRAEDPALDRVTTPAVDDAGTRGAGRDSSVHDKRWTRNQMNPSRWDSSCRLTANTSEFALRLPDGRTMPFDSSSNAKIAAQLKSEGRVGRRAKILRVQVEGQTEGGAIRASHVKM